MRLAKREFDELSASNPLPGGIKMGLLMGSAWYIQVAIDVVWAYILSWISLGLAIILVMEQIREKACSSRIISGRRNRYSYSMQRWPMDNRNMTQLPHPGTGRLLAYPRTPRISGCTTGKASKLTPSLAVAILANTEGLGCGSGSVSGMQRLFGSGFSILRNLELPLSRFRGQMRGTLPASSAMTSHSVYEDLFVSGKCFPQLANPPLSKLHYLIHTNILAGFFSSPTVYNTTTRSNFTSSLGKTSILDSITLQDTRNTAHTYTDHPAAATRSSGRRKKSTHFPTPPRSSNVTGGNSLLAYLILYLPSTGCKSIPLPPQLPQIVMGSVRGPPSYSDTNDIFNDFINPDYLLSEVPSTLDFRETAFRDNLLQQQRQHHPQEPSPLPAPKTNCTSCIATQPHPDLTLKFSESHFLTTEMTEPPLWADPFDLFSFDLVTPRAVHVNDLLATTNESIPQARVTSVQSVPPNATAGAPPQSPTQSCVLPPTPFSLPSSTTSPTSNTPAPSHTAHSTLTHKPTTTTTATAPPSTAARPLPKPRPKKTFPCTSPNCCPTATTRNPETTHHHHHHKDPKHRFCCSYEGCASCTSYTTRKDRRRHEASKHGEQRLMCDVCGHTTAREDNMRIHVRAAHNEECEAVMKRILGFGVRMVLGLR